MLITGNFLVFAIGFMVILAINFWIQKRFNRNVKDTLKVRPKSERYAWLDMFRGLLVVFLTIASITWGLSGVIEEGIPVSPPIGPVYLNHGWRYYQVPGWPQFITIIDIGQQILMFIMGFSATMAYYSHVKKEGEFAAFLHFLRRFFTLMLIAVMFEKDFFSVNVAEWDLVWMFWKSTFANLAWGGLGANIALRLTKQQPEKRIIIAFVILIMHTVLYSIPEISSWSWQVNGQTYFEVPWNMINHISIAIVGSCAYDWYMLNTKEDPNLGWRKRILPIGALCFALSYVWDYIQWADHGNVTSALALNAIASSLFLIYIFYSFERSGFIIRPLVTLGKNLLLMFAFTGVWDLWLSIFSREFLTENHIIAAIVVGVIPIVGSWFFAKILERKNIIVKF